MCDLVKNVKHLWSHLEVVDGWDMNSVIEFCLANRSDLVILEASICSSVPPSLVAKGHSSDTIYDGI